MALPAEWGVSMFLRFHVAQDGEVATEIQIDDVYNLGGGPASTMVPPSAVSLPSPPDTPNCEVFGGISSDEVAVTSDGGPCPAAPGPEAVPEPENGGDPAYVGDPDKWKAYVEELYIITAMNYEMVDTFGGQMPLLWTTLKKGSTGWWSYLVRGAICPPFGRRSV